MNKKFVLAGILFSLALLVPASAFAKDNGVGAGNRMKLAAAVLGGRASIGNATLVSKSDTTLVVTDKNGKQVTVVTDSNTKLWRRFGAKSSLDEMSAGDKLTIVGTWTDSTKTTVKASSIRDLSIQKRAGQFLGIVKSVSSDGFVVTPVKRGDQAVTVSSTTKFVNLKNQPITLADIHVGNRVRVTGMWDMVKNTLTETSLVKDFSL